MSFGFNKLMQKYPGVCDVWSVFVVVYLFIFHLIHVNQAAGGPEPKNHE